MRSKFHYLLKFSRGTKELIDQIICEIHRRVTKKGGDGEVSPALFRKLEKMFWLRKFMDYISHLNFQQKKLDIFRVADDLFIKVP